MPGTQHNVFFRRHLEFIAGGLSPISLPFVLALIVLTMVYAGVQWLFQQWWFILLFIFVVVVLVFDFVPRIYSKIRNGVWK